LNQILERQTSPFHYGSKFPLTHFCNKIDIDDEFHYILECKYLEKNSKCCTGMSNFYLRNAKKAKNIKKQIIIDKTLQID
jgi:hypothetical protein